MTVPDKTFEKKKEHILETDKIGHQSVEQSRSA